MAKIALVGGDGRRSGIPTLIHQLCIVLTKDHSVDVYSDVNQGGYDFLDEFGLPHNAVSGLASRLNPLPMIAAFLKLRRLLVAKDHDLIWVQSSISIFLARIILIELRWLRRRRTALVVAYQGVPFGDGRKRVNASIMRALELTALTASPRHSLLFTSRRDQSLIPKWLQRRHEVYWATNCSTLPVAADDLGNAIPANGSPPLIVMTTRVSYQKNLLAAADLFSHLPAEYQLVLVGPDTALPEFKQEFLARLSDDRHSSIRFEGMQRDVIAYLLGGDFYLMTSRYEGLPFGAVEAFQCGLPIALTDVGGTQEIAEVHPLFSIIDVASAQDIEEAAAAVHRLVERYREDPGKWRSAIHDAWRGRFSFESWEASIKEVLDASLSA